MLLKTLQGIDICLRCETAPQVPRKKNKGNNMTMKVQFSDNNNNNGIVK